MYEVCGTLTLPLDRPKFPFNTPATTGGLGCWLFVVVISVRTTTVTVDLRRTQLLSQHNSWSRDFMDFYGFSWILIDFDGISTLVDG